ncbi:ATP-binding protein [Gracilibacillus lacisalsi]|uniref:ATP-binding protein n=1 Tax=Gracilibacillus lacisalsi TaxID=393087 RepID=UPI0003638060|nr:ATP-binding protein [Gracilibacillus lacisalsi]
MKRFFTKRIGKRNKATEKDTCLTISPSTTFQSFNQMKEQATIGWIVYQLADGMGLAQNEELFFESFTLDSIESITDEKIKEFYQLAQLGIGWITNNDVIEEEIKKLDYPKPFRDLLLRTLNEIHSSKTLHEMDKEKDLVWEIYRDVIYSATQGAFLLIDKTRITQYKSGKLLLEVTIKERKDISYTRNLAKEAFANAGLKESKIMSYNLIISESVTNVIKHAKNGRMLIYQMNDVFHVIIEDNGPGFPLNILPKTTLLAGFSTKESLGQGFTLMMKMAEQVILETSSDGSTLILLLDGKGEI